MLSASTLHSMEMFVKRCLTKNCLSLSRFYSSLSKNYICDSSVIEAYKQNQKFQSIVDRAEHHFYYEVKDNVKDKPPAVFKPLDPNSRPPPHSIHLTHSSTAQHERNRQSIEEFLELIRWNDRSKGRFPGLVGLEVLSIHSGYVCCQLKIREELLAPNGYLHAGVIVTLADTACGYGCIYSKPSEAKSFTTIELKSNFMRTAKPDTVIKCEARLVHGGRSTQVWDAEVRDTEKNKLLAVFRCTELLIY